MNVSKTKATTLSVIAASGLNRLASLSIGKLKSIGLLSLSITSLTLASHAQAQDWQDTLKEAKGETVYFDAWGGSDNVNNYIQWAAKQVKEKYDITLKQVKLTDTASAVNQILAEKAAGKNKDGSVDLIWINGENFRAMKDNKLLYGPFSTDLPNYKKYVDPTTRKSLTSDFGTPVDGMESPWGRAQLIFMYDSKVVKAPPLNMKQLLAYAAQHPGRVTYPAPPQFLGTTFLKQALYGLMDDPSDLQDPVSDSNFKEATAPLWRYLDKLNKFAWHQGKSFPKDSQAMMRLLDDQEIDIAMSFDVSAASAQIDKGNLPDSVRSYVFTKGTIGNTHFLAIPYNSSAKAAAQVVANFMLSPEAQIEKQKPSVWGDLTVLSYDKLSPEDQAKFNAIPKGVATLSIQQLGKTLPEPNSTWVNALEKEWRKRYAQ